MVIENDGELAEAWNAGLEAADTEWVLFWADDDVALPGFIDSLTFWSTHADVVYPTAVKADETLTEQLSVHPAEPFCPVRLRFGNYIVGSSLVRREKALEAGGFRDLPGLEDWDLWLRMSEQGARFVPAPDARFLYRQHPGSRNQGVSEDSEAWKQVAPPPPDVPATFYNQGTPATTYLRCQLPARHLGAIVVPDGAWAITHEGTMIGQWGGTAVFQFPGDQVRALATQILRETGHRVLVEVDDNYLIQPGGDWLKNSGWKARSGEGSPHSVSGHRWIVNHSDGVIVTTEQLAKTYRKTGKPVFVCPNTVDPADWPDPTKPDDGILRIAWVASNSHLPDIPLVTRAMEWASRQKDVQVFSVGLDPKWTFEHGHLPWLDDLASYRDMFRHFDIGLAPVKATPSGLCRSDVKALEYAMGGVCPVVSDVACYDDWRDGENCLKATNAESFLRQLKRLVRSRDEAKQLAAAAREYVLRERTTAAQVHLWEEAIAG